MKAADLKTISDILLVAALFLAVTGCRTDKNPEPDLKYADFKLTDYLMTTNGLVERRLIEDDRLFVGKLKQSLKDNPTGVDKVFTPDEYSTQNLGFGYSYSEASHGGYHSLFIQMLYHNGKLISYRIKPYLPEDTPAVVSIYREMYRDVFHVGPDGAYEDYCYNPEAAEAPMAGCPLRPGSDQTGGKQMGFFMSPFSGLVYGTRGGFLGNTLENRECYLEVQTEISPEICLMLLYSSNPATRLTAYEHYLVHQQQYGAISSQVEDRMREVFAEKPRVKTMKGCIGFEDDATNVVDRIVKQRLSSGGGN